MLPIAGPPDEPLPGVVVRDLVAWSERTIDDLQLELKEAQRELEDETARLARHPAAVFIADEVRGGVHGVVGTYPTPDLPVAGSTANGTGEEWLPASAPATTNETPTAIGPPSPVSAASSAGAVRANGVATRSTAPRTTVVRRPSSSAPATNSLPNGQVPSSATATATEAEGDGNDASAAARPVTRSEIIHSRSGSRASRFMAPWMMKAGIALVLIGVLLLKFG
jgi:hypothetical protein